MLTVTVPTTQTMQTTQTVSKTRSQQTEQTEQRLHPRRARRWRAGLAVAFASFLLAAPAHAEPGFAAKFLDGFIVRPLLLVPTLVSSTLGVGIYPISFLINTDEGTTYYLIEVPVAYLRDRPLGSFRAPTLYPIPSAVAQN